MGNLRARITDLITKAGPPIKEELVYVGEKGKDDYAELGVFKFKRLTFEEMDLLRLHSLNEKGQFDANRYAGNNARQVAATLIDDDGAQLGFDEINQWPGYMVDAFSAASNRANSNTITAAKEVEKDSGATGGDAP